jgi:hypothetical protein
MSRFMDEDLGTGADTDPTLDTGTAQNSSPLEGIDGSAKRSSSLRSNILLLLFVVGIAGGAMFLMRKYSSQLSVELTDVKIEYTYEGAPANDAEHANVLQSLSLDEKVQIPLNKVRHEPFRMTMKSGEDTPQTTTGPVVDPQAEARRIAEARRAEIQKEFERLKLHSVITGSVPIARISGQPVRIGDSVGEYFRVEEIRERSVVLIADDEMYILAL